MLNFTPTLLKGLIQKEPGAIVGPITSFLGVILNAIFNFVTTFTEANSLGISIIFLTIITRMLMFPLAVNQQKSMVNMAKIQPDVAALKKKYDGKKDPESTQKMNAEIQTLYSKHKINPLMGCLPLFIQMPIFIALSYIMQSSYSFIDKIGQIYYTGADSIVSTLLKAPGFETFFSPIAKTKFIPNWLAAGAKVPPEWQDATGAFTSFFSPEQLAKVVNRLTTADWNTILAAVPVETQNTLNNLLAHKTEIETFFGIHLIENSVSFSGTIPEIMANLFPGAFIPIIALVTTFFSTYIMGKVNKPADENAVMQQKMMLYIMPVMMGFMTAGFPAGVGIYWNTSTIFQIVQQLLLNKYFFKKPQN